MIDQLKHLTKLTSWPLNTPMLVDLSRVTLIERLPETTLPLNPPKTFTARTRLVLVGAGDVHVNEMPEVIEQLAKDADLADET